LASAIKTISDAIISRLVSQVSDLNAKTVRTFSGSLEDFIEKTVKNTPFVGVHLAAVTYDQYDTQNRQAEEHLEFDLLLIIKDLRSKSYGKKASYDLIDDVRDALIGQSLSVSGLNPIRIESVGYSEDIETTGYYGYRMIITTFQIRE